MIRVAVVGHAAREEQAVALADSLGATLFIDRLTLGATWNHLNALNWAAQHNGNVVVLEDDAQPVAGFLDLAEQWTTAHPDDLTSFYLGTGRPTQYQEKISAALATADADHLAFYYLMHAVAYTLPCAMISRLKLSTKRVPDLGLGMTWHRTTGRPILYTVPSYVDHADTVSIEQGNVTVPRKAWRLHEGLT